MPSLYVQPSKSPSHGYAWVNILQGAGCLGYLSGFPDLILGLSLPFRGAEDYSPRPGQGFTSPLNVFRWPAGDPRALLSCPSTPLVPALSDPISLRHPISVGEGVSRDFVSALDLPQKIHKSFDCLFKMRRKPAPFAVGLQWEQDLKIFL